MSLTNFELQNLANRYELPLRGVYMKDELVHVQPQSGGYIVNLQSSTQGSGTHWTLVYIHTDPHGVGSVLYCDPFGAPAPPEVSQWYEQTGLRSGHNVCKVQNVRSQLCGWYAIGMMMYIKAHSSPKVGFYNVVNDFINMFGNDATDDNGPILKQFYKSYKIKPDTFVKRRLLPPSVL